MVTLIRTVDAYDRLRANLDALIRLRRVSRAKLARAMGVSGATASDLLNGKNNPNLKDGQLDRAAAALGVDVAELFREPTSDLARPTITAGWALRGDDGTPPKVYDLVEQSGQIINTQAREIESLKARLALSAPFSTRRKHRPKAAQKD